MMNGDDDDDDEVITMNKLSYKIVNKLCHKIINKLRFSNTAFNIAWPTNFVALKGLFKAR